MLPAGANLTLSLFSASYNARPFGLYLSHLFSGVYALCPMTTNIIVDAHTVNLCEGAPLWWLVSVLITHSRVPSLTFRPRSDFCLQVYILYAASGHRGKKTAVSDLYLLICAFLTLCSGVRNEQFRLTKAKPLVRY